MADAPAADDTLKKADAPQILEELLPAQNRAKLLGVKLGLPDHEVEAIILRYPDARDRLYHIIIAFLRQVEPRPTWRVIVEALRSPGVGLPDLAKKLEEAHFPDSTATRHEPVDTESAANTTATGDDDDEVKSKTSSQQPSPAPATGSSAVEALQEEIKGFHRRFNSIQELTIKCLEKCPITVVTVVFLLVSALGECKGFLETKRKDLRKSEDHWELFEGLNFYWNYLCFGLLHGLIEELFERNKAFGEIKEEMEKYSQDMQKFRARTKLVLFCKVKYRMLAINPLLQPCDPPPGFRKMVTEHPWPETVTLKDVEEFRKQFLLTFGLPECAIMVNRIENKCFEITWFAVLSPTVLQLLKEPESVSLLKDFEVSSVEIDGECVYQPLSQLPPEKEETEAVKEKRFEQLPGPERARRVRESVFELAGSRPPLVDPSPLYSGMVKFSDALFTLEDDITNTIESLKKSEKIKEVPAAIDAFRAIRRVGHQALTVVEKFNDIFHHGRKTKHAREALIYHDDAKPLRELLDTVKNCIDDAKAEYKTFEDIYQEASNACSAAGRRCKEKADSAGTIKKITGVIGNAASATAIGISVFASVGLTLSGILTGGLAPAIVLGAAGIGGFYLTSKLVEYYREAEIIFADVSNLFNEELLNSVSKIKGNVDEVRRRVSTVETDIELYEADREATCRALDNQHVVFSRFYEETLSHVTSLRQKVRELDNTINQFLA